MSGITDFLSRIQSDYRFYLRFREDPEEVLKLYELSSKERLALTVPGLQLWHHIGHLISDAESPGAEISKGPVEAVKWRSYTTQSGCVNIDLAKSAELYFNVETVLERPEVQHAIAEIRAANTHNDRLAAVTALVEQIE
jgi:hypothetical protein